MESNGACRVVVGLLLMLGKGVVGQAGEGTRAQGKVRTCWCRSQCAGGEGRGGGCTGGETVVVAFRNRFLSGWCRVGGDICRGGREGGGGNRVMAREGGCVRRSTGESWAQGKRLSFSGGEEEE